MRDPEQELLFKYQDERKKGIINYIHDFQTSTTPGLLGYLFSVNNGSLTVQ
jgi:hypothetical protein